MIKRQVRLNELNDIVMVRHVCREMARQLGFGSADQTRLATAISEIARNAIQHAGGGLCVIISESNKDESRMRIVVKDQGPGISDIDKAMEDDFSTCNGLGAGLPAAKRLVHQLDIKSQPGNTEVTLLMKRRKT